MKTIKSGKIKSWQMSSIIRKIFLEPGITRLELSKFLKMDKSLVTWHTNLLRQKGYIKETNPSEKLIPLKLIDDKVLVAGVELQPRHQVCVITTVSGKILCKKKWKEDVSDIPSFIDTILSDYLASLDYNLIAVGIALPGPYRRENNTLLESYPFNLTSPLELPTQIGNNNTPLFYDNDARCCGWGIVSFEKETDNFLLILSEFEEGINSAIGYGRIAWGMSLFLDKKMQEGSHSCAGESQSIFKLTNKYKGYEYIDYTEKLRNLDDPAVLEKIIREYARSSSFIANFLDLGKIYIGGSILEENKNIIEKQFGHYLLKNISYPHIQKPQIAYTNLGNLSIARGAAGLAYERLFLDPIVGVTNPFAEEILSDNC